jgi:hypothetical protein
MSFDMMGSFLEVGDVVVCGGGTSQASQLRIGRIVSKGPKMAVLEPIEGHPKSIGNYRAGKRYYHDLLKIHI